MKSTGKDGASPGGHADVAEGDKCTQYGKEYVGLNDEGTTTGITHAGRRRHRMECDGSMIPATTMATSSQDQDLFGF